MNYRERFQAWMHYKDVDRAPFYEWLGYWSETVNRWRAEGLSPGVDIFEYFGFDKREGIPIDLGPIPRFVRRTIEENERYEIFIDWSGIKMKRLKCSTSMPQFIEFPVKNRYDWELMKERFDPNDIRRLPLTWSDELFDYYAKTENVVYLSLTGFFGYARNLMGLERLLIAFFKEPDLVADIMDFWSKFLLRILEIVLSKVKPDYVTIWEDMCYKSGPLISPRLFEEFMLPNYKKITNFIRGKGIDIIMVDTDGNHVPIIELFLEGGVNCLYPLEVAANVDAVKLRENFGRRLLLIGNIDKRALIAGSKAIDKELGRIKPLLEEGGYIISIDHCVPADVPFKHYMYYIRRARELIENV
ncbi:MAG: hypothetical protein DRJ66_07445 [Thermoprotei archaeon]|nr:MAG: hypothetical protein DRJ66_07445 [Thermoprotei archaeon]